MNPRIATAICWLAVLPAVTVSAQKAESSDPEPAAKTPAALDVSELRLDVSKAEIDLPVGTDPYDPAVYAKAGANLNRMIDEGILVRDQNFSRPQSEQRQAREDH